MSAREQELTLDDLFTKMGALEARMQKLATIDDIKEMFAQLHLEMATFDEIKEMFDQLRGVAPDAQPAPPLVDVKVEVKSPANLFKQCVEYIDSSIVSATVKKELVFPFTAEYLLLDGVRAFKIYQVSDGVYVNYIKNGSVEECTCTELAHCMEALSKFLHTEF